MADPITEFGWVNRPEEVERLLPTLIMPELKGNIPVLDEKKDAYLYEIFRKTLGFDPPKGPQKIGDCVSWGWSNLVNYLQAFQIANQLKSQNLFALPATDDSAFEDMSRARGLVTEEYEEIATEATYALSRVEVGGQRGSYSDGSTGVWASKAAETYGYMSRPALKRAGLSPDYDPKRAKDWGAKGLPDELEPVAKKSLVKVVSIVRNFNDAATVLQSGYTIAICSNRGFTMTRDNQGFCKPLGVWNHCMLLCGLRWDRPGCCISQSWGPNTPQGPLGLGQPDNTFWADASVIDYILGQNDSFTGSQFMGYQIQDIMDWKF